MFISGIRHSEAIYSYNSIRLNVLRREMIEADCAKEDAIADVKKAMSDMARDFSLQQYQYFVRTNTANQSSAGLRTGKQFAL